nr:unnamed protein product [Spirometra erinaceieuropaei]
MESKSVMEEQMPGDRPKKAKFAKVKSKMPAPVQITAEQLLREAKERELEVTPQAPTQKITNLAELRDFQLRKRKDYEDNIRKNRLAMQNWIKYAKFEESQGELQRARSVFERALDVDFKNIGLWLKYAEMEMRNKQVNHARNLWDRAVTLIPRASQFWYKYTYMEEMLGNIAGARQVFERWMEWEPEEQAWHAYINFELRYKELQRARLEIEANSHNYDVWFDYVRLMEEEGSIEQTCELYERAVANVPPIKEKRYWRRYIYLWINYAIFEELTVGDPERTRQVYNFALRLIPHRRFTFAKFWLYAAKFEIRQKQLTTARKLLGTAIGKCPKAKLFRGYIELEIQLREFDRCRRLYEKFLAYAPENCTTWMRYAEMEALLDETERARGIYELAVAQPLLDMPELLWKAYIDYEIELREWDRARSLYRRLMKKTQHVKVWLSLANFELCAQNYEAPEGEGASADENGEESERQSQPNEVEASAAIERARAVYREANFALRRCEDKEQRVQLIDAWKEFEAEYGDDKTRAEVASFEPQRVVRSRRLDEESGGGWEEYVEYIFPDADTEQPNRKLLALAANWAMRKGGSDSERESEEEDEEDVEEKTRDDETNAKRKWFTQSADDDNLDADEDDVLDEDDLEHARLSKRLKASARNPEEIDLPDD